MKAIISSTYDDNYFFFLPIVTWSWNKLGVDVICITPYPQPVKQFNTEDGKRITLYDDIRLSPVIKYMHEQRLRLSIVPIESTYEKAATYAQCSRLYAAALPDMADNEILITGDADMAVFNKEYFKQANNEFVHVFGADLVPPAQYPICYISMPAFRWRAIMNIAHNKSLQDCLDGLLGHLDCEHFRGNYWAKDQETIYQRISDAYPNNLTIAHNRAKYPYQFAKNRVDRDDINWESYIGPDLIDAHLWRPGYTDENFAKILQLFQTMYPEENFDWMVEYRNEYVKLIQ